MAKKNGTSWFTAVKRVLWSPSKDSDKKIHQKEAPDYNKKKEKKGWIFRKTKPETINYVTEDVRTTPTAETEEEEKPVAADEVVAEIITLRATPGFIRRHWAAIIIQTAFRGYLARKALRALKGIVKLQALVRGNNVRNQAKLTLRCIKALVRVQDQVLNHHQQRSRIVSSSPSYYNLEARRNSMFAESNGFLDSRAYLQDIRSRRSLSRDMSRCSTNDFVVNQEETQSILHKKLEIAIKREKAQALALSNQIRRRNLSGREETEREILERSKWLNRWMATKEWDNNTITQSPIKTQRSYPVTPRSASPRIQCFSPSSTFQPNYMTATESAKAKARTQSTPRRRPTTAKKRLCYVEEESLSCVWGDHDSDYSCCYGADGFNGKISPCSTTDLRWLK